MLRRRLGMPERGRSQLETVFFNSREAIVKAVTKSGNPSDVFPFVGVKITSIFTDPESYNPKTLKSEGMPLGRADEGESVYVFFGVPVKVEMECFLFTNSFQELISTVERLLFISSELHFRMNIDEGVNFDIQLKINKDGLSIPEADFQSQISTFEFSFPAEIKTYAGVVEKLPLIRTVRLQGGPVVEYVVDEVVERRVQRAFGSAIGVTSIDSEEIVSFKMGLNQDKVDTTQLLTDGE